MVAISFIAGNMPREGEEWDHLFMTPYQIGCEALVAFGHADVAIRGAIPRANPKLPQSLPRWDDICIAVLWLAEQQGKVSYRGRDGRMPPPVGIKTRHGTIMVRGQSDPPPPNISSACGLGPAHADQETMDVLIALGIAVEGRWTDNAETILWRTQPPAWDLDTASDPRFVDAVRVATATIPDDLRSQIDRLATITDEDIAASIAHREAYAMELRAEFGPKAQIPKPRTVAEERRSLHRFRCGELDWIFFRRWRLPDGWLSGPECDRALGIFHDRLAIQMRRAVLAELHPEFAYSEA